MEASSETKDDPMPMTIKLVIDRRRDQVMYAESGKEFVDVLLSFLTLPVAAIVKIALRTDQDHCFTNIYSSVENMSESLMRGDKAPLLQPKVISNYTCTMLGTEPPKFLMCGSRRHVLSDDLKITPLNSTAAIVNLWNKCQVKELSEVEERNVTVGPKEVTGLLKAAMASGTALNEVFKSHIKSPP